MDILRLASSLFRPCSTFSRSISFVRTTCPSVVSVFYIHSRNVPNPCFFLKTICRVRFCSNTSPCSLAIFCVVVCSTCLSCALNIPHLPPSLSCNLPISLSCPNLPGSLCFLHTGGSPRSCLSVHCPAPPYGIITQWYSRLVARRSGHVPGRRGPRLASCAVVRGARVFVSA